MAIKTAGVGHFTIPTAPAAGTSCTSGAANVFTTTYVQLIASTAAALYITGIYVEEAAVTAGTYIIVQLATGGAGSETIVGQYLISPMTGSTVTRSYRPIFPPIPVATATRIACKTADSVGAQAKLITLECIAQSNVVDSGIVESANMTQVAGNVAVAVGSVTFPGTIASVSNITSATGIDITKILGTAISTPATAGILDVNVKNMNNVAGTAITTVKAVQGLTTADTITTTTNLTNLPSIPANWLTAAGINAAALNGKGDWATVNPTNLTAAQIATGIWTDTVAGDFTTALSIGKSVMNGVSLGTGLTVAAVSGAVGSVTGAVGSVTGAVGSVTAAVTLPTIPANWIGAAGIAAAALNGKGDWLLSSGYTAPDNTSVAAIKVQTDKLAFNVANQVNSNITYVNAVKVNGLGTAGTPWGP